MKRNFYSLMMLSVLSIGAFMFSSCGDDGNGEEPAPAPTLNSLAVLEADANYSTLVAAINKAGMAAMFSGSQAYTLFAPDNQMMRDAGVISVDDFTADELKAILEYHMLAGNVLAADLPGNGYRGSENKGGPAGQGLSLYFTKSGEQVNINSRHTINTTTVSTNGVVHFIGGGALLPPTVYMQMNNNSNLTRFHSAAGVITNQGSSKKFRDEWNDNTALITVFAPINSAVEAYESGKNITIPRMNPVETSKMMNNHVITGSALTGMAIQPGTVKTDGYDMTVSGSGGSLKINGDINVTVTDVYGTNGVLHIIDKLIEE
jgi:transforming growth factor-beta-induced protein